MKQICKNCGAQVYWLRRDGKVNCYELDYKTIHWDKCSARRTLKAKREGIPFKDNQHDHGYLIDSEIGKKKYYMQQKSLVVTGKNYKPSNDRSVPWKE